MNFSVEQKKDKTLPKFKHQKFNLYMHIINTECSFHKFYVAPLNKYYKNITLFKKKNVYNKHCRYMYEREFEIIIIPNVFIVEILSPCPYTLIFPFHQCMILIFVNFWQADFPSFPKHNNIHFPFLL